MSLSRAPITRQTARLTSRPLLLAPLSQRYGNIAPRTALNFAALALGQTFGGVSYRGSRFHHVIDNFMVQVGGCPMGGGWAGAVGWGPWGGEGLRVRTCHRCSGVRGRGTARAQRPHWEV